MKKLVMALVAVLLILTLSCACAADAWVCLFCGKTNHANYCTNCGKSREEPIREGDSVTFGHYPQTASGNDSTPIEWIVLDTNGNNVLLISRYGLDTQAYNTEYVSVTWETCTMRKWLNETFINAAFTAEEQKAIESTWVDNDISQCYDKWNTNGGNNTLDKIFLLSYAEANKYFDVKHLSVKDAKNNIKSRVEPTAYAIKHGAYTNSDKTSNGGASGWWWLRSPGENQDCAAYVDTTGALDWHLLRYLVPTE